MNHPPEMTVAIARAVACHDYPQVPREWLYNATQMRVKALEVLGATHDELCADVDAHLDRIDELADALRDLLRDCDNWGVAPDSRYGEVLG